MDYKIDKVSFYFFLEKILNAVYDEGTFKLHMESRDIMTDEVGKEYKYSILNDDGEKMFESSINKIDKVNNRGEYLSRHYKTNDSLDINQMENLLAPYTYKYRVLEIVPMLLETYLEETKVEGEINSLDESEMKTLIANAKEYNESQKKIKIRSLNTIRTLK